MSLPPEGYDPKDTAAEALLKLRLVAGMDETVGVIEAYGLAARLHGADQAACDAAVHCGRADRAACMAATASTLFTIDELLADWQSGLVCAWRRDHPATRPSAVMEGGSFG
ncbi:hypothetical protein [Rhodanobacter denitrificans]|uniref:Uncharacterized protein n=1 Tax=Rhodanobacter denitrificans TaxID=666685 RepID=M4NHB1_9GAMM|nr:hypothetical protein [Rhodanobacter denitrificans]AGG89023.1 hypothetical protein R2APBS1_1899 [Rhodanobacter denitrificans]UJJ53052.1 hypothetical protein LRK52_18260 [Rhodanobacter denitrificans]